MPDRPKYLARLRTRYSRKAAWEAAVSAELLGGPELSGPTIADPGTQRKAAILAARLRLGLPLFHDRDAGLVRNPDEVLAEIMMAAIGGVEAITRRPARVRELQRGHKKRVGRGVFEYYPAREREHVVYRAKPSAGKRGKWAFLGFFPTRAEAALEIILWRRAGCPPAKEWRARRAKKASRPPCHTGEGNVIVSTIGKEE